jgi:hypothetical protein
MKPDDIDTSNIEDLLRGVHERIRERSFEEKKQEERRKASEPKSRPYIPVDIDDVDITDTKTIIPMKLSDAGVWVLK